MHQQAREAEKRLVNVIEQSSELMMITDAEANIEYVNPAFEKVSGYSKDELLGKIPALLDPVNKIMLFMLACRKP